MSISIVSLWLVLAALSCVTAFRARIVHWLGRRTIWWRILALLDRTV